MILRVIKRGKLSGMTTITVQNYNRALVQSNTTCIRESKRTFKRKKSGRILNLYQLNMYTKEVVCEKGCGILISTF